MTLLTLNIVNTRHVLAAEAVSHQFDKRGGTIGSLGADWLLQDREHQIQPVHCEIRWIENTYCLIDRCGQTSLNGSRLTLAPFSPVRLREGDCLGVGAVWLCVHAQTTRLEHSLDELFKPHQGALDTLLAQVPVSHGQDTRKTPSAPVADICEMFAHADITDPLAAMDALSQTPVGQERRLQGERP
ncbi:FHA domain-containing protein [Pseudomonas sp. Teo4]|uniref:FHA domain-containing protein n=1 Tax=Pseudomonas sp. Teo4 TaxID=3064528 RepID=UPI002AB9C61B|nr:FHA domain-containing protein [Pseudomonas sp. Teo4]MDZ3992501.1 hypothetical protein [Pseudomonas sp. Teo4]